LRGGAATSVRIDGGFGPIALFAVIDTNERIVPHLRHWSEVQRTSASRRSVQNAATAALVTMGSKPSFAANMTDVGFGPILLKNSEIRNMRFPG